MDGDRGRTPPCPPVKHEGEQAENKPSALVLTPVTRHHWLQHRLPQCGQKLLGGSVGCAHIVMLGLM